MSVRQRSLGRRRLSERALSPLVLRGRPAYESYISLARALVDEQTFGEAWAEGQAMTVEQAIAHALKGTSRTGDSQ